MQTPWSVSTRKSSAFPIWYQVYIYDGIPNPMRKYPLKLKISFSCIEMMLVMATEGIYPLYVAATTLIPTRPNLISIL